MWSLIFRVFLSGAICWGNFVSNKGDLKQLNYVAKVNLWISIFVTPAIYTNYGILTHNNVSNMDTVFPIVMRVCNEILIRFKIIFG